MRAIKDARITYVSVTLSVTTRTPESVWRLSATWVPMAFVRDSLVRGGTYSKFRVESGRKYFVNAGSVGEPRDGNSLATYTIYNLTECSIELRRVHYDVARTEAKVREAGLPVRRKR